MRTLLLRRMSDKIWADTLYWLIFYAHGHASRAASSGEGHSPTRLHTARAYLIIKMCKVEGWLEICYAIPQRNWQFDHDRIIGEKYYAII